MIIAAVVLGLALPQALRAAKPDEGVRVIRAEIGPIGSAKGDTFVFDEQRDVFNAAADKEVIVAFEWEGAPGTHRCELSWIKPDGSVGLQTRLDLRAQGRRFSGFWSLVITPALPSGLWAAEVKIDGVAAGSKTFRVQGVPVMKPLAADELYKLASETTLSIEADLGPGIERRVFSGFAVGDDAVLTVFSAVNAARSLTVRFSDGSRADTDAVWLFSRDFDWVLLKVPVPRTQRKGAPAEATKIGDSCAFLQIVEGEKQLGPCNIIGQNTSAALARWVISNRPAQAAFGAPVIDSQGAVVGLVGVDSHPGGGSFEEAGPTSYRVGSRVVPSALLVLPVKGIQRPSKDEFTTLASFWDKGLFYRLVTASRHVGYGFLAVGAARPRGEGAQTGSSSTDFYAKDGTLSALVQWRPRDKVESTLNHACFDASNRPVFLGKPSKISLRPGVLVDSSSQFDVSQFKPGEYRLDVLLGEEVAWRTYFQIKP